MNCDFVDISFCNSSIFKRSSHVAKNAYPLVKNNVKLGSSGNDPRITKAMRYSSYVTNMPNVGTFNTIRLTPEQYVERYGPLPQTFECTLSKNDPKFKKYWN